MSSEFFDAISCSLYLLSISGNKSQTSCLRKLQTNVSFLKNRNKSLVFALECSSCTICTTYLPTFVPRMFMVRDSHCYKHTTDISCAFLHFVHNLKDWNLLKKLFRGPMETFFPADRATLFKHSLFFFIYVTFPVFLIHFVRWSSDTLRNLLQLGSHRHSIS